MSTILKALRRLEQEKSVRADRPLSEAVVSAPPPSPSPRASRGWPKIAGAVAVGAVVVGAGVFAALQWLGSEPPASVEVAAVSPAPEEATTRSARAAAAPKRAQPAPAPSPAARKRLAAQLPRRSQPEPSVRPAPPGERGLSPQALTSDVAVVDRGSPKPRLQDPDAPLMPAFESIAPTGASQVPFGLRSANTPAESLHSPAARTGAAAATPPVELPPIDLTRFVKPPPVAEAAAVPPPSVAEAAAVPPGTPPAPKPATIEVAVQKTPPLPSEPVAQKPARTSSPPRPGVVARAPAPAPSRRTRLPMPVVFIERTIWHPDPSRRVAFVEVDGSGERLELHEGEAVGSLVVEKIEPTGVSFDHHGIEVHRRVGAR